MVVIVSLFVRTRVEANRLFQACPLLVLAGLGPSVNFNFFFICSVPGGLDYAMLYMVKNGMMKPLGRSASTT